MSPPLRPNVGLSTADAESFNKVRQPAIIAAPGRRNAPPPNPPAAAWLLPSGRRIRLRTASQGGARFLFRSVPQVFSWTWYEPDRLVASTYYGGPMRSFDGYLYFGSINFPFSGAMAHTTHREAGRERDAWGGPANPSADRGVIVVRGRGVGSASPTFELLYGEEALPKFSPGTGCVRAWLRRLLLLGWPAASLPTRPLHPPPAGPS